MLEIVIRGALIPDSTLHEKRGIGVRKNIADRFHRPTGRSILRLRSTDAARNGKPNP
jgi:hypothetical protein